MSSKREHLILFFVSFGTFLIVIAFGLFGIIFVYLGSTGTTEFTLIGQTFKSTNVGIGAVFIGAVVVIFNIRRLLKSLERIRSSKSTPKKNRYEGNISKTFW